MEGELVVKLICQLLILQLCLPHCGAIQCSDGQGLPSQPTWNQSPQFTPCSVNNQTAPFYSEIANEYTYSRSLPLVACADAPDTALCWRTCDTSGTVELRLPLLPNHCAFTTYQVSLLVNEAEDCMSVERDEYKLHSTNWINVSSCDQPDCSDRCDRWGTVEFRHVFSACYKLLVNPCISLQKKEGMESVAAFLNTGHNKTFIQEPIMDGITTQSARVSMKAAFPSIPTQATFTLMSCGNYSERCQTKGMRLLTCETNWESSDIKLTDKNAMCENLSVKCYYQGKFRSTVSCDFSNLEPGKYLVRVKYFDDRCSTDSESFWGHYNSSNCLWELFYEVLPGEEVNGEEVNEPEPTFIIERRFLVTSVLLVALVFGMMAVYLVYQRIQPENGRQLLLHNPINFLQPPTRERPVVWLLYARDCQDFMSAVAQLRNLICNVCNCQVVDVWNENQCGAAWEGAGAARWVQSHLMNTAVRVVYVTSPASSAVEVAHLRPDSAEWSLVYQERDAADQVLPHALVCMRENNSFQADKRLFVVRLDADEEGAFPLVRTYLYPQRSYVLPVNLSALLSSVQNLSPVEYRVTADAKPLAAAVTQYRRYLSDHPRYLDSLLDCRLNSTQVSVYEMLRPTESALKTNQD